MDMMIKVSSVIVYLQIDTRGIIYTVLYLMLRF